MNAFKDWVEESPARHIAILFLICMAIVAVTLP